MKSWYNFQSKAAGVLNISIHDEIGAWGVEARSFMQELKEADEAKVINLSIHSPGGDLLDGLAIYNSLRSHQAKVYARVEGIAASAASIILMGADNISMPEDAYIMIHNPWTVAIGDADEMRAVADVAEKMQDGMAAIYERRTGLDRAEINSMMAAETWMTAAEAMEFGFIDNIAEPIEVAAKLAGFEKHFKSLPIESEGDTMRIDSIENINDLETYLRDAGKFSRKAAKALVARSKQIAERDARPDDEDETVLLEALNKIQVPASLGGAD